MNRISKFLLTFMILLCLSFPILGYTQQKQPPQYRQEEVSVKVIPVRNNIYEVKGGRGANCGFFIGKKEVLVIDTKMTKESARAMIAEIRKLTDNPITRIVITHSDGDHVNGLPGFPADLDIISHRQAREDMAKAEIFKDPVAGLYLPNVIYSKKHKIRMGKSKIKLLHFGPAHTSGDTVVYFPKEKVAFLGDLIFLGREPLVHRHKNGSSFGLVKTLKSVLKLKADIFVHGHGDQASKNDVEGVVKALEEKQKKIKALIKEGKTLEEIKEEFNIQDQPARPGRRRRPGLVEIIYLELTEKK